MIDKIRICRVFPSLKTEALCLILIQIFFFYLNWPKQNKTKKSTRLEVISRLRQTTVVCCLWENSHIYCLHHFFLVSIGLYQVRLSHTGIPDGTVQTAAKPFIIATNYRLCLHFELNMQLNALLYLLIW